VAWALRVGDETLRAEVRPAFTAALAALDGPLASPPAADLRAWRAHGLATVELLEESPLEGLPSVEGGTLPLPAGPGLGVRLREAAR
jgi:L-alanine-DL-glutamate epimerase-like enolase superfamily enzyme